MNRFLILAVFLILILSCNHKPDEQLVESEDTFDYLSEIMFRFDMNTYVLISEKYGFTDLRLINAMKEYQKNNQFWNIETTDLNITESSLLDSMIIDFHQLAKKYSISPDTLASAILDFKFTEKCEDDNF